MPLGLGICVGAIAALAVVLPLLFDRGQRLDEQRLRLGQLEEDISSYSRAVRKLYPLLGKEQLGKLFEGKGRFLLNVDRGRTGDDSLMSAELRKSPEGVYFIWCRTGAKAGHGGASFGYWLARVEAIAWAEKYATPAQFRALFEDDGFRRADRKIQVGLCE